jgi:hypothetical protein
MVRILMLPLVLGLTGCATHSTLARKTVCTNLTLCDINYRQVLDNVAMFEANPWAIPAFASVTAGTVTVSDQHQGSFSAVYSPTLTWFMQAAGGLPILSLLPGCTATREVNENWSSIPVVDTDNLQRLRCYFQLVVLGDAAPNFEEAVQRLHSYFLVERERLPALVPRGWYGVGCSKKAVPKNACYVGSYSGPCGCRYVWVLPDGLEGLARCTLSAMDIATGELHAPTKTIVKTYDKNGVLESTQVTTTRYDAEAIESAERGLDIAPDRDRDTDLQRGNRGLFFIPR